MKKLLVALVVCGAFVVAFVASGQTVGPGPVNGGAGGTCSGLGGDVTGTCAANHLNSSGVVVPNASTATTQTSGDGSTLLATDAFVTANIAAVSPGIPVQAATTAALSGTWTYSNGTGGNGATLTAASPGALCIDTYCPVLNDRLVIKNQASTLQNGCYTLTTVGTVSVAPVLTRCTDYNTPGSINTTGTFPVLGGSTNINTGWFGPTNVSAIGTSAITFTQDSVNPTGPPNGNVKAQGNLTKADIIIGQGGKTVIDSGVALSTFTNQAVLTCSSGSTAPTCSTYVDASETCTSTSFAQCTATADTITFTLSATANVSINFSATAFTNDTAQVFYNVARIDGTNVTVQNNAIVFDASTSILPSVFVYTTSLSAGSHTIAIWHKIQDNGSGHNAGIQARLTKISLGG